MTKLRKWLISTLWCRFPPPDASPNPASPGSGRTAQPATPSPTEDVSCVTFSPTCTRSCPTVAPTSTASAGASRPTMTSPPNLPDAGGLLHSSGGGSRSRPPVVFGPYVLLDRIGQGGMGHVFCLTPRLGRRAALKVVRPDQEDRPGILERFVREVRSGDSTTRMWSTPTTRERGDGPSTWRWSTSQARTSATCWLTGRCRRAPASTSGRRPSAPAHARQRVGPPRREAGEPAQSADGRVLKVLDAGLVRNGARTTG